MKMLRTALAIFLLAFATPALAQWQTKNRSVPIGRGGGVTGFGAAVPNTAGIPLVSNGPSGDPSFSPVLNAGIQPGTADTYKGTVNGVSETDISLPSCAGTNQALQYVSGTGPRCGAITATTGYDMPTNMGLSASAAGGALTINLTTASGATPTAGSPVNVVFRSTNAALGTAAQVSISTALSLTVPSTATLGTSSGNVPFRLWIFLAFNSGTPELAVSTCSNTTTVFPCAAWDSTLKTTTVLNTSSTSAGVPYAPTAATLDAMRLVGYCDYSTGLGTAGTWASSCTNIQLMGPGVKKPGDVVQTLSVNNLAGQANISSLSFGTVTNSAFPAITLQTSPNLVRYNVTAEINIAASAGVNTAGLVQFLRTSTAIGAIYSFGVNASAGNIGWLGSANLTGLDAPGATGPFTYQWQAKANASGSAISVINLNGTIDEIMG